MGAAVQSLRADLPFLDSACDVYVINDQHEDWREDCRDCVDGTIEGPHCCSPQPRSSLRTGPV